MLSLLATKVLSESLMLISVLLSFLLSLVVILVLYYRRKFQLEKKILKSQDFCYDQAPFNFLISIFRFVKGQRYFLSLCLLLSNPWDDINIVLGRI